MIQSSRNSLFVLAIATLLLSATGCTPNEQRETVVVVPATVVEQPPPPTVAVVRPPETEAEALGRLALDIQVAPNARTEAEAIERMRMWLAEHNLTYQIRTIRPDTNRVIQSASTAAFPVRTELSIYRGQTPMHDFSFMPKDNRNLALLGQ